LSSADTVAMVSLLWVSGYADFGAAASLHHGVNLGDTFLYVNIFYHIDSFYRVIFCIWLAGD
jgi:hypothetical protein